jgi:predicted RNA-binding Zn-ribbon protein involved in translation (DUF1610 family)
MPCTNATPIVMASAGFFSRPSCPRCGEEQYAPELSQFAGANRVHNAWSCDACGHRFLTSVEFGEIDD